MSFKLINDYVHEYDFFIEDLISPYKESIINSYIENINNFENSRSIPSPFQELNDLLLNKFDKLLSENYILGDKFKKLLPILYIQDNKTTDFNLHNHVDNENIISAVTYIDPPHQSQGGELELFHWPHLRIKINPQPNKIYIFPAWMYHTPLPQFNNNYRICINLAYSSFMKPTHKETKIVW